MAAFTTIAAGASLAAAAGGTTASFIQAGQARKRMQDAQDKAAEAMEDARRTLTRNAYDALSVPMQEYEQQREALITAAANVTGEGDQRGVGAVAGAALGATQKDLQKSRADIEKSIFELDKLSAAEEQRLSDEARALDLAEVEGAQMARAAEDERRAAALTQGFEGVAATVGQAASMAPLYAKQGVVKRKAALQDLSIDGSQDAAFQQAFPDQYTSGSGFDVSQLSNREFRQLERSFTPAQKLALDKAGYYKAIALPEEYSGFFEYGLSGLPKEDQ